MEDCDDDGGKFCGTFEIQNNKFREAFRISGNLSEI
jgi:hypothetical protein